MQEKKSINHELFAQAIKSNNYTLSDVAKILGVSICFVHNLRTGTRKPSGRVAVTIRDNFGLAVEDWFC